MIKSNKDFIPQIAEEQQLDIKEVSNLIEFYFRDAKAKAEGMVDTDIYLYGFGTLSAKRKKIYDLIIYYGVKMRKVLENPNNKQNYKDIIEEDCIKKINQLNILAKKYQERDEKRKELKLERETITRSIQESSSDLGRIEEQSNQT